MATRKLVNQTEVDAIQWEQHELKHTADIMMIQSIACCSVLVVLYLLMLVRNLVVIK